MKKKRTYEQPRTDVVELRVSNQLLMGSTVGTRQDFENTLTEEEWGTTI